MVEDQRDKLYEFRLYISRVIQQTSQRQDAVGSTAQTTPPSLTLHDDGRERRNLTDKCIGII
jgi:hypothetical protein